MISFKLSDSPAQCQRWVKTPTVMFVLHLSDTNALFESVHGSATTTKFADAIMRAIER